MVGPDGTPDVPDAFEAFYRREYGPMVALAYGLIGSRNASEDVAQDAFLRAHRNWDRLRTMESPGGWIRVVTMNLARSRWRRLKVEVAALFKVEAPGSYEDDQSAAEAVEFWSTVRRLPSRQAQVVALHYIDDLSIADIAGVLDIAEGTVKASLHQARQRLQRDLREEGWVPDGV